MAFNSLCAVQSMYNDTNTLKKHGYSNYPIIYNSELEDEDLIYADVQDKNSPEPPPIPPRKNKFDFNVLPVPPRNNKPKIDAYDAVFYGSKSMPASPLNTIGRRKEIPKLRTVGYPLSSDFGSCHRNRKTSNSNKGPLRSPFLDSEQCQRNFMESLNSKLYQFHAPNELVNECSDSYNERPPQPPPRPPPINDEVYLTADQLNIPSPIDRTIFKEKERKNYENVVLKKKP